MRDGRRMLILAVCCLSLFVIGLDNTIVNIALPAIRTDLNASVSGLQWTVDAYTLVLASLLMLGGSTADRIGRRRIFQTGLVLFTTASLLCGLAPGLGWLIAFRVVQAVGGSMLNPVALSIVTNTFPEPRERARAIGVWGAVFGISLALGPVLGGLLVHSVGWRAIFWINVPVGVAALALARRFVPESRAPHPRRVDPVGQILVIAGLAALSYAIIEGPGAGWGSARIVGAFALAGLALVGLLGYEPRRDEPLVELRLFRSAPFCGATTIAVTAFSALAGMLFLNTLYLQDARGLSALHAGLYTLPTAAVMVVAAPLSGRLVGAVGPRIPLLVGGSAIGVGGLLLVGLRLDTPTLALLGVYGLFGIGFGMVNAPITSTAVAGLPREQAGVAAAFASTSRQVGQTLGVAIIGTVVTSRIHGSLADGFAAASHLGWWLIAGCGALVVVLGLVTTGPWAQATSQRAAALLNSGDLPLPEGVSA